MSHPTHHYLFDQSENCKTCSLSFFMLFLLHTGLSACKDFSLLHLASQRSTSTAYHLILNRSVSPAHPARGDPVPAGRSACMAVHSPRMSSWESCVAGSSATAQATGAGPGGSVGIPRSLHVGQGAWVMLQGALERPDATCSKGWTLPSCRRNSVLHGTGCHILLSHHLLSHRTLVAPALDVLVFAEETKLIQVVKFTPCL